MHASAGLISPAWRWPLAVAAAACGVGVIALSALVLHGRSTSFDTWTFEALYAHIGNTLALALLAFSLSVISIALLAVVTVIGGLIRRWDVVALAVAGPGITLVLTEYVLKPVTDRTLVVGDFHGSGVFPSGHESVVASAAIVLAIVAGRVPASRRTRAVVMTTLAVWTLLAAIGLVRNLWHYATDTMGAICLAGAIVPTLALGIDAWSAKRSAQWATRSRALAPYS